MIMIKIHRSEMRSSQNKRHLFITCPIKAQMIDKNFPKNAQTRAPWTCFPAIPGVLQSSSTPSSRHLTAAQSDSPHESDDSQLGHMTAPVRLGLYRTDCVWDLFRNVRSQSAPLWVSQHLSLLVCTFLQVMNGLMQTTGWPAVVACVGNWFGKGKWVLHGWQCTKRVLFFFPSPGRLIHVTPVRPGSDSEKTVNTSLRKLAWTAYIYTHWIYVCSLYLIRISRKFLSISTSEPGWLSV